MFLASIIVFVVLRALPGDVAATALSGSGETGHNAAALEALRQELGLDEPLPAQYGLWLLRMVNGEFGGASLETRQPIRGLLARQVPVTLQLVTYAAIASVLISLPLGVLAGYHRGKWPDVLVRAVTLAGAGIPPFAGAMMVLLLLVIVLGWSPPIVYANLWQDPWTHVRMMAVPVALLSWEHSSQIAQITRANLIEVMGHEYIRTARSKGLADGTILKRHAVRNALIPTVTLIGVQVGGLLSGVVALETIFGVPGLGRGLVQGAVARDYPVVQSYAMVLVFIMLCTNLLLDVLYVAIDPRISFASGQGS